MAPLPATGTSREIGEVRVAHGLGVTEWWRTAGVALEHGVTLDARPPGDGPLELALAFDGLSPRSIGPGAVALDRGDATVAQYAGLVVVDAGGAHVPATLSVDRGTIRVRVDDASAVYPIVVDPLVFTVEGMLASGSVVSMSSDGARVAVGWPSPPGMPLVTGIVSVYARSGSTWSVELSVTDTMESQFGAAIALDATGSELGVYASGGAYAWFRTGSAWTSAGSFFPSMGNLFRPAVAVIGARYYFANTGGFGSTQSITVVTRVGTSLGSPLSTLIPSQATALAASADGSRLVVATGTATLVLLTASMATEASLPVSSAVAISGDAAHVALCGSPTALYVRSGGTWSPDGTAAGACTGGVALDQIGRRVFVSQSGAVAVLDHRAGAWTNVGSYVPPAGAGSIATAAAGDRVAVAQGAGPSLVITMRSGTGDVCGTDAECGTGHCVDGVCCATTCGGNVTTDCQACSNALTGLASGTCGPLSAAVAPTVTCRPSAGICDPAAEVCSHATTACPSDVLASATTVCRAASSVCDAVERCTGTMPTCPADANLTAGTPCRPVAGPCDIAETCTGSSPTCPVDNVHAGELTCRPSTGVCDPPEVCNGTATTCPVDVISPPNTPCGPPAAGPCDLPDVCDGTSALCPTLFRPAGFVCAPAGPGVCDAPDTCDGSTAACNANFATGVVCRPQAGACDVAEACSGTAVDCPPDSVVGAGLVCRASTSACDPAETCDGLEVGCPADVLCGSDAGPMRDAATTTDGGTVTADGGVPGSDGGRTDGSAGDGSVANDTGTSPPPADGGCGCRTSTGARDLALLLPVALALLAARRLRAGARRGAGSGRSSGAG